MRQGHGLYGSSGILKAHTQQVLGKYLQSKHKMNKPVCQLWCLLFVAMWELCITDDDGEHSAVFPFKVYLWALDSTQTVEIISTRLTEMSTNSKILLYPFTRNAMGLDGEETNAARWRWKLSPVFPETCYGCGTGGISGAHIPSGKTPRIPVSQNTYWLSKETAILKMYMYVSLCISHITL